MEPSNVDEFEHIERDPESPLLIPVGKVPPDIMALDAQMVNQLATAIVGLQDVVQDPARGQELTDALKGLKEEVSK